MQPLLVLFMAASTSAMMAPCTPPPGCKNDQKTCFLPMPDSPDICPPAPLCIDAKVPASIAISGMCENHCPNYCKMGDMICPGGEDSYGCKLPDICMPTSPGGIMCPSVCPSACRANEYSCPGMIDSNGCKMMDICFPKITGKDGKACPPACPIFCTNGLSPCPRTLDANGCPPWGMCVSDQSMCPKN